MYIKSRKEKLFDFIGGSNAPSSSGVMARGITIRYDQRLFLLDENFVVFNPEKKNPYVKHLISLKVYDGIKDCLTYKSHYAPGRSQPFVKVATLHKSHNFS
uniref:Uncharacterized protein n=1 Tax=Solanum tuberosum TaxID=4113 RepID=M1ACN6_SOLTU